jgi:quercetin dioxygenase-like cupin family protein
MSGSVVKGKFAAPVDRAAVAGDWRERGYSCGLFVDPPGREWNDFVHSTNELVTVTEGKLAMTIGGERYVAAPGDEIFIPKNAVHSVKNIHSGTTSWLYGYD